MGIIIGILALVGGLWVLNKLLGFWQINKAMNSADLNQQERDAVLAIYPTYAAIAGRRSGPQLLYELSLGMRSCRGFLASSWYGDVKHRRIPPTDALTMLMQASENDPLHKELRKILDL